MDYAPFHFVDGHLFGGKGEQSMRSNLSFRLVVSGVLALVFLGGCAAGPVTLVDPKTQKTVTCPEALSGGLSMTSEQSTRHIAWYTEFQRTHNRVPTPMEGCLNLYETLGFVRKP